MKKFYYPAVIAVLLTSCSSASTVSKVEPNSPNKTNFSDASPATRQTIETPANRANSVNQANKNAENLPNANQRRLRDTSVSLENLKQLKSKGGGDQNAAPIPATAATPFAAPDDSEISATMNSKGVPIETRIFKNNRMLAKVERTFEDASDPVTKVYLKNGKVLTVPKGAIANSATAAAADYLRAVGVKP